MNQQEPSEKDLHPSTLKTMNRTEEHTENFFSQPLALKKTSAA